MQPEELRQLRKALRWKQRTFAAYLGISMNYYSLLERGTRPINTRINRQLRILVLVHALWKEIGISGL